MTERTPAEIVPAMIADVLAMAHTWTSWTGDLVTIDGRTMTPHKQSAASSITPSTTSPIGGPIMTLVCNGSGYSCNAVGTHRGCIGSSLMIVLIFRIDASGLYVG